MWRRWKAGQSLHEIGCALGKDHVVHFMLARHGGIAPTTRRRSRRVLTLAEREESPKLPCGDEIELRWACASSQLFKHLGAAA